MAGFAVLLEGCSVFQIRSDSGALTPPEYRIEAANLVIDTGRSIAAVAKDIGVGEQTLGTWVKAEKHRRRGDGESTGR